MLLTGGNGFIGNYVLRYLIESGNEVNAIVRGPLKLSQINRNKIKIFIGDINDSDFVNRAAEGCDIIIHLAALVRSSAKNPSDYFRTNIYGTSNLLKASVQYKIKKFVFISSLSAHDYVDAEYISEDSLIKPERYFNEYAESKARAEELVIEYAKSGISYIIIYPTRVFGIGPLSDSNAAAKAISLYLKNRLPFLVEGGSQFSNWAFVEDVARGIVKAAASDLSNETFILGGENRTLHDVYNLADEISGKKHLRINLKMNTALNFTSIFELLAKLSGRPPLITRKWLNYVMDSVKISCRYAVDKLNYEITPFNPALEKTVDWLNSSFKTLR